jgi:hypothetical protein
MTWRCAVAIEDDGPPVVGVHCLGRKYGLVVQPLRAKRRWPETGRQERIMPQIEALYVVEFGDVAIGGETYTYWNGGVVVLEANRILGGDSGYYYLGNYTLKDSQFEATAKIVRHNPSWEDAFGSTSPSFNIKLQGTVNSGVIQGTMERLDLPGVRLQVRLTLKEELS